MHLEITLNLKRKLNIKKKKLPCLCLENLIVSLYVMTVYPKL